MGEIILTQHKYSIKQRVKFLSSLLFNPKFYRIISDVLNNPSKLDSTLGTLCYFSLFLSALIKKSPEIKDTIKKFWRYILKLINKFILIIEKYTHLKLKLPDFGLTENYQTTKNKEIETHINDRYNLKAYKVLKTFSGYLTDIRIFNRGFSIPACIADIIEARSLLEKKDYLNYISTWCISLYQPLETIAFLFDHNWLLPDRETNNCDWWYAISTRFWFAWVVAEFSQLSYRLILVKKVGNIEKSELIEFIEHLATLPLCVHWSLENGCLNDFSVGLLGTIAGGLTTIDMWKTIGNNITNECL